MLEFRAEVFEGGFKIGFDFVFLPKRNHCIKSSGGLPEITLYFTREKRRAASFLETASTGDTREMKTDSNDAKIRRF